jgi:hypothetical protein
MAGRVLYLHHARELNFLPAAVPNYYSICIMRRNHLDARRDENFATRAPFFAFVTLQPSPRTLCNFLCQPVSMTLMEFAKGPYTSCWPANAFLKYQMSGESSGQSKQRYRSLTWSCTQSTASQCKKSGALHDASHDVISK